MREPFFHCPLFTVFFYCVKFPFLFSFILVNVASLLLFIVNDVEILLCRVIKRAYTYTHNDKKKSKFSRPNEDKALSLHRNSTFPMFPFGIWCRQAGRQAGRQAQTMHNNGSH